MGSEVAFYEQPLLHVNEGVSMSMTDVSRPKLGFANANTKPVRCPHLDLQTQDA
jgi:hypothetical protein